MTDIADRAMTWNEVFWTVVGLWLAATVLCAYVRANFGPPQRLP